MSSAMVVPRASKADSLLKAKQQKEYPKDLWIFLASVVAFLTVIRVLRALISFTFRPKPFLAPAHSGKGGEETLPQERTGRFSFRRVPSALASTFRVVAFRINVPIGPGAVASVVELLFIIGYIVTMLVFTLIDTQGLQTWFFEDRAAHLASCQLPLVVALAGKNNVISFLTGVSHEKLNVLHRASARTCLLFLWMHAVSRASSGLPEKFDFTHAWMRWGAVGLAAFTLAAVLSVRPIRNAFFEFFLISHILLIGIFLIGGYLHARQPNYGDYIWPALVVWAFDRVLRAAWLMWNNRFGVSKHYSTATVELISSDTVRLTLRRRFNWRPGQHAYVILPTVSSLPTEAHPFTIASIPQSVDGQDNSTDREVVFLIRGREGFTGRLREHASAGGVSSVPALVDGPYGCPPDLSKYTTCILVAGGSGVSYILPLFLDIVRQARLRRSSVQRVVFVWAVRDADHIRWISKVLSEALDAAQSTNLIIDPRIYITCASSPTPPLSSVSYEDSDRGSVNADSPMTEKSEAKLGLPVYSALRIMNGRPAIRKILHEEIAASRGPVSVDVAGPSNLSQSVAQALSSGAASPHHVLKGAPSVTLHVETFGMTR